MLFSCRTEDGGERENEKHTFASPVKTDSGVVDTITWFTESTQVFMQFCLACRQSQRVKMYFINNAPQGGFIYLFYFIVRASIADTLTHRHTFTHWQIGHLKRKGHDNLTYEHPFLLCNRVRDVQDKSRCLDLHSHCCSCLKKKLRY